MNFEIFRTIEDFLNDKRNLSGYKIKFLFHSNIFNNEITDNIKDKIYKIVPRKNIFFINSYETLRTIRIISNLNYNMEYSMLRHIRAYSLYKTLENIGVNPIIKINENLESYNSNIKLFDYIYNRCIIEDKNNKNAPLTDLNIYSGVIPNFASENNFIYSIRNLEDNNETKIDNFILDKSRISMQNVSDIKILRDKDLYYVSDFTNDVNPILLLPAEHYLEFFEDIKDNFKGKSVKYFIENNKNGIEDKEKYNHIYKNCIDFKYNKMNVQRFLFLISQCDKIYTNSYDLLCLSIIFNKPIEYIGKEYNDYIDLINLLGIKYDNNGSIINYKDVLENLNIRRKESIETLKTICYSSLKFLENNNDNIQIVDKDDYIEEFKKHVQYLRPVVQNTIKEKQKINNISLVIPFHGNNVLQIDATKKSIDILMDNQKYIPNDILFVEYQKKEEDFKFEFVKKYGFRYIKNNIKTIYENIFLKLDILDDIIHLVNTNNIVLLDSDCFFVNEDAFLNISKEFENSDFQYPFMFAYRSSEFKSNLTRIKPNPILCNKSYYPGFALAIKKEIYEKIRWNNKLNFSYGINEDSNLLHFLLQDYVIGNKNYYYLNNYRNIFNIKVGYAKYNIICHTYHGDRINRDYLINSQLQYAYGIKRNSRCDDILQYNEVKKRISESKLFIDKEHYIKDNRLNFFLDMDQRNRLQECLFDFNSKLYGNFSKDDYLNIIILNNNLEENEERYQIKKWMENLQCYHNILNLNSYTIDDFFNIFEKYINKYTIIVRNSCILNYNVKLAKCKKNSLNTFNYNNDVIYFYGNFSYINRMYLKESDDFREFMSKYRDIETYLNIVIKNDKSYSKLEKYITSDVCTRISEFERNEFKLLDKYNYKG